MEIHLEKALESLSGVESEFANGRFNNCANRCYYACFQAAISALLDAGIRPRSLRGHWAHDFVQSEFVGRLINRQKLYPADLRQTLFRTLSLRHEADYGLTMISSTQALRALFRSRQFVNAVRQIGTA